MTHTALTQYEKTLEALLAEARMALGAEFCGPPDSLAGRIDDVLHPVQGEPVLGSLPDSPRDNRICVPGRGESADPADLHGAVFQPTCRCCGARLDDRLLGSLADPADLVFEQYSPDGFAWFRK